MTFLFVSILACKPKDTIQEESLAGKWNIMKALRNGKETPYLRGGYFIIGQDGKIVVNISGEEENTTYTLDKHVIRTGNDKDFVLKEVKTDSMTVHFMAGPQSEFVFYMVKQHDEPQ